MNTLKPCHSTLSLRKFWLMSLALVALTSLTAARAARIDRYVDKASATPSLPYDAWTNAATDIQSAVNAAVEAEGDQVIVRAGVYDTGGTEVSGLTNRVYVNKAITLRSENNDPINTIIQGVWDPVTTNGPAAVRPVRLNNSGARLIGFTITNGATLGLPTTSTATHCGGGVYVDFTTTVVSNCVIVGNRALGYSGNGGGGAFGGTYYKTKITRNSFANLAGPASGFYPYGAGAQGATLYDCELFENAAGRGGGANNCTLYRCVVSNNTAQAIEGWKDLTEGGGVLGSKCYDSVIVGNSANRGGGARYGTLQRCVILENVVNSLGGGAYGSILLDCQVISNRVETAGAIGGGGIYQGSATNTVVAYNTGGVGGGAARTDSLVNCLLYGNEGYGGGVYFVNGGRMENCTLVGNKGSGVTIEGASVIGTMINCITHHNYNNSGGLANCVASGGAVLTMTNCSTKPEVSGWDASNSALDPLFVDKGTGYGTTHVAGNYRLRGDSPCVNAGLKLSWMTGHRDLGGNPRLDKMSGIVDMGAYEYVYQGTTILVR